MEEMEGAYEFTSVMQLLADSLEMPVAATYDVEDPLFKVCVSIARLTRGLDLTSRHVVSVCEHDDPTCIAVIRSVNPIWYKVASSLGLATDVVPFDIDATCNAPRTLFGWIVVKARKIETTCLRCKTTFISEANCRMCLRSHRETSRNFPKRRDLEFVWNSIGLEQRMALCVAIPPAVCAVNLRARLARSIPPAGDVLLRAIRGDEETIQKITGRDIVMAIDVALEGGIARIRSWDMEDFREVFEPAEFQAYIATLLLKKLVLMAKYMISTYKTKMVENALGELTRIEEKEKEKEKAAMEKKARMALKKKERNKKIAVAKYKALLDANQHEHEQHPVYAQLASPCRFLAGVARCLLESVDGDASKLVVYKEPLRQPGGFDPVAAEINMRRRVYGTSEYIPGASEKISIMISGQT
jgi:hypothetical protein